MEGLRYETQIQDKKIQGILGRLKKDAKEKLKRKSKDAFFKEVFYETQNEINIVYENFKFKDVSRKIISGFSIREAKPGPDSFYAESKLIFPNYDIEIPTEKIIKLIKKKSEIFKDCKSFKLTFKGTRRLKFVENTLGNSAFDDSVKLYLVVQVVYEKNGKIGTARESISGEKLDDFEKLDEIFDEIVKRAKRQTEEGKSVSGKMPVVILSSAGGVFVHECIGHAVEADHIAKNLSVFKGKLGEKIGSDIVNIVDDPTYPHQRGTHRVDDEGTPAKRNVIVENGILKNYIVDLKYSFILGIPPTSSGKRESYEVPPIPRMTNTIILPGESPPDQIIRECWKGILIKKLDGGEVDTATGDFVFGIEEGYEIEMGKIGEMIKKGVIMGKADESLKRIVKLGNDLGFSPGTCGKDGQWVPVSDAQPTALFEELLVGTPE
jgi:TldD protein